MSAIFDPSTLTFEGIAEDDLTPYQNMFLTQAKAYLKMSQAYGLMRNMFEKYKIDYAEYSEMWACLNAGNSCIGDTYRELASFANIKDVWGNIPEYPGEVGDYD